jgi:hypothetical protein
MSFSLSSAENTLSGAPVEGLVESGLSSSCCGVCGSVAAAAAKPPRRMAALRPALHMGSTRSACMSVAKGEATSGAAPGEIHAEERDEADGADGNLRVELVHSGARDGDIRVPEALARPPGDGGFAQQWRRGTINANF